MSSLPPLSTVTFQRLAGVVADPPDGNVIVVDGPAAGPGAQHLARGLAVHLGVDPDLDVDLAAPDAVSWRRAEVDEQIIGRSRRSTDTRHVIVVLSADRLDGQTDRLLKTFEEPPAPSWFLLAWGGHGTMPATLASRAAVHVNAQPADHETRVAKLVAAGVDRAQADALVSAAGDRLEIDQAVSTDPTAAAAVTGLLAAPPPAGSMPVDDAVVLTVAIDTLAGQLQATVGSKPAARVVLTQMLLQQWAGQLVESLRSARTRAELVQAEEQLALLDETAGWLDRNIPPAQALPALAAGLAITRG